LHAFETSFTVPKAILPFIVGRGGSKINKFKSEYDVRIDISDLEDSEISNITIEGIKSRVLSVKEKIESIVDEHVFLT
jgi:helix-turn-helix protein